MNVQNQMNIDVKEPKKRNKTIRVLLIIFCVLVAALICCGVYIYLNISKIWGGIDFDDNTVVIEDDENFEGLPEVTYQEGNVVDIGKSSDEIDIMLIGVDNRNSSKFTGLSDVMMYMRINTSTKSIKIVSFMRDTLVKVEGYDKKKLNTAYSYGGTDLMYQTYEENFGLRPDCYMVVNFYGMEDIIDALGGVDIEITSTEELNSVNGSIKEINDIDSGKDAPTLKKTGFHHLSGRQAVAYMRTRHPGGDGARIKRQQAVLNQLFEEASNVSVGEIPALIGTLAEYVRTDIQLGKMLDIASAVKGSDLQTFSYPENYENGYYSGAGSIVQPKNFDEEYEKLFDFLND